MSHGAVVVPLQLLTIAVTASLAVVAWRHRSRPGARPFAGLMGAMALFSALAPLFLVTLHASPGLNRLMLRATITQIYLMPLFWILFVLEYCGHSRLLNKYTVAALAVPPGISITILWSPFLSLLTSQTIFTRLFALYMLGYLTAGILLLVRFVIVERRLYTDQSAALLVGVTAPIASHPIRVALTSYPQGGSRAGVSILLSSFAVTGLAFGYALFRFDLDPFLPVTRRFGRDIAIEDLGEGVFIVDREGTVVDLNDSGAAIFDRPVPDVRGASLADLFGEQAPDDPDAVAAPTYETVDGRTFDVSVSPMHDRQGRVVGHTVVFRDVTDRELRETQLEVLNRVLRHNLRNKLSIVEGHADVLSDRLSGEDAAFFAQLEAAATELLAVGDRARQFEQLETRADTPPQEVAVATLVGHLVDRLSGEFPDATVATDVPPDLTIVTYPDALEIVLENLLANAAEHSDQETPAIEVTATATDGRVAVTVADDGPGIPEHELAVLEAGAETALDHGSGLGLWITRWGVRYLGGELAFEANQPRGTKVTVTVPGMSVESGRQSPDVSPAG